MSADALTPAVTSQAPAQRPVRPGDPGPVTRRLLNLVQVAGEQPSRLAADYADHLRQQPGVGAVAADLRAMAELAAERHPAGVALVRALLSTAPAGHRLLGAVRSFGSTRRLRNGHPAGPPAAWAARCDALAPGAGPADLAAALRGRCDGLLSGLVRGQDIGPDGRRELAELLTLETEARDERIRDLAARVVERGVMEAEGRLRQVARLDAALEEVRDLAARLAAGGGRAEIIAPHNRFVRSLGDEGRRLVDQALAAAGSLERLALVWRGIAAPEPAVPDPESAWLRLRALAALPVADLVLPAEPDPLALAALVVAQGRGGRLRLPLSPRAVEVCAGPEAPELPDGVVLDGAELVIACDDAYRVRPPRPQPAAKADKEQEEEEPEDMSKAAVKRLVLQNLQSTSVTIAFLRDPKVFSVPGLVEEVVNRVRNPQIVEMIATQRPLHAGFANRGVPLALLKCPVNVSVRVIRRFIHVKYVSKIDLRRLANDRTGIRKEVGKEIEKYLASLA